MYIAPVPKLVAEIAAGRMVFLVDEEDRENDVTRERLPLPPMTARIGTVHGTAFAVSIEAATK